MLTTEQLQVRTELTRAIAELGHAPSNDELANRAGLPTSVVEEALCALHGAHALLLHPGKTEPWAVHPFALSPGSCWVEAGDKGYWANCVYCAFGIAAALGRDATIFTRLGGEREHVEIHVRDDDVIEKELLFHLSTPPKAWWDNVIHACASFQPFRTEGDVDRWCERHALPKGAVVPLPTLWAFARDWYGDAISKPWRKRSTEEVREVFRRHGFTSPFWAV